MKLLSLYQKTKNPWIIFLPLLILYITIIVFFKPDGFYGDEARYLTYANNLLNGFYADETYFLLSGPGYPLMIVPAVYFNSPLIIIRTINALLLYSSLILVYYTILVYSTKKNAKLITGLLGLYFPIYFYLTVILSEVLTWFLISAFCFIFIKTLNIELKQWKYILYSSVILCYLIITKVIFGYAVTMIIILSIIYLFIGKDKKKIRRVVLIFSFALALSSPYLIYTYSLTGKIFYWSSAGGESLYNMSSPFPNEQGDWFSMENLLKNPNHSEFIEGIYSLSKLEQDKALRKRALKNISDHPFEFTKNYIANIGRFLFNYPYSYRDQTLHTYLTLIPNMYFVVFISLAIVISIIRIKQIPFELVMLLIFILVYFVISGFVSGEDRMFSVTVPFWIIFLSFVFTNIMQIDIKNEYDND